VVSVQTNASNGAWIPEIESIEMLKKSQRVDADCMRLREDGNGGERKSLAVAWAVADCLAEARESAGSDEAYDSLSFSSAVQ
jgi:hypothetical protein